MPDTAPLDALSRPRCEYQIAEPDGTTRRCGGIAMRNNVHCYAHGKRAAREKVQARVLEMGDRALDVIDELMKATDEKVRFSAAKTVLDRAAPKEPTESRAPASGGVQVQIGFLQAPGAVEPRTIAVRTVDAASAPVLGAAPPAALPPAAPPSPRHRGKEKPSKEFVEQYLESIQAPRKPPNTGEN